MALIHKCQYTNSDLTKEKHLTLYCFINKRVASALPERNQTSQSTYDIKSIIKLPIKILPDGEAGKSQS